MLAWPHADTDWHDLLDDAEATYTRVACAVLEHESLLIICRDDAHQQRIRRQLTDARAPLERLHFHRFQLNDTWARDFGPLTVADGGTVQLLDYQFNGWGGKFPADRDNAATAGIDWLAPRQACDWVLEGGSIDGNGAGLLLTTRQCLLNPNRNPQLTPDQLAERLQHELGAQTVFWLAHGALEGDDTDAHVDTLARFCSVDTIAYVQCTDDSDSHFSGLAAMEQELRQIAAGHNLKLVPLPLPSPCFDDGERLPATYANFLIINGAVLVPTYDVPEDAIALERLGETFADREVIGIDCRSLIRQHGSLHCITMQLPEGVL
jgi:agmatine/peptidylarginine deiminase